MATSRCGTSACWSARFPSRGSPRPTRSRGRKGTATGPRRSQAAERCWRMSAERTFVIAGAGLAGARAAEALREEGFDGRLVLIGEEPERPYERPPLSKDYLRGESEDAPYVHPEGFYRDNGIELLTSTPVAGIEAGDGEVFLDGGGRLAYDRLLIATGGEPRRLDAPGGELAGIHSLRTLADSNEIRGRIGRGGHLVVVGSGWIGAEIAASARQRGCEVTMIEMS